jgi:hypothetical protein
LGSNNTRDQGLTLPKACMSNDLDKQSIELE